MPKHRVKPFDGGSPTGLAKPDWYKNLKKLEIGKRDWYKKLGKQENSAVVLETVDVAVTESAPEEKTVPDSTPVAGPE